MTADVPEPAPGEVVRGWLGDMPIAVWNVEGTLYAIGDLCPHRGDILSSGPLERGADGRVAVVCPGHSWRFDLATGESLFTPECVPVFEATAAGGRVVVTSR